MSDPMALEIDAHPRRRVGPPGHERRRVLVLIALILFSVAIAATAQLTLKHGMNQVGEIGRGDLQSPVTAAARVASNLWVWVGLALFAASAVIWLIVLSRASLSFAYPFASLTYVLILLADKFVLHQEVPVLRWAGVFFIVTGILLISRTPHT